MSSDANDPGPAGARPARHLLHVFPTFEVGGAQVRFGQLAQVHGGRYRHTVVALDSTYDMCARIPASVALTLHPLVFDKKAGLGNLPLFRRTMTQLKPDRLVTYNWGAIEWCLANRFIPIARHVHIEDGFGPEEIDRQLRRRVWTRRLALSGRHTQVVFPSRQLVRIALQQWRLNPKSIIFIPNGIDAARFARAASNRRRSADGPLIIGTLATLRKEKDLGRLIRAFAAVASRQPARNLKLVIVGDGPERPSLESLAASLEGRAPIVFPGATSNPEEALADMDIFALSSQTEQMPMSVLEAMAAARPIVSVAVGDIASMVSKENLPFVTPIEDEAAFRTSLEVLAADAALRDRIGRANQAVVREHYDQALMASRYAALFG